MTVRIRHLPAIAETVLALGAGWLLVFVVPFRQTTSWLGTAAAPSKTPALRHDQIDQVETIAFLVPRVARRMPWRTTCLVQAIAGYLLLRRRRIAAAVRFGVNKTGPHIAAHAWLIADERIVLGAQVAANFTPIADLGDASS